jgi:hypothetical protein
MSNENKDWQEERAVEDSARIVAEQHAARVEATRRDVGAVRAAMPPSISDRLGSQVLPELPGIGATVGKQRPVPNPLGKLGPPSTSELPDDHDEVLSRAVAETTKAREQAKPKLPTEHPVLAALKADLGLYPGARFDPVDSMIGNHKWTMFPLTGDAISWIARVAETMSQSPTEREMRYSTMIGCYSVVAIDGVPTWQVYSLALEPGEANPPKPLFPTTRIRRTASLKLYDWIQEEAMSSLALKIYEAYVAKCDEAGYVAGIFDDPKNPRVRFRCDQEGCKYELVEHPEYVEGTQNIQARYCKFHGTIMEPKAYVVSGEEDRPLISSSQSKTQS